MVRNRTPARERNNRQTLVKERMGQLLAGLCIPLQGPGEQCEIHYSVYDGLGEAREILLPVEERACLEVELVMREGNRHNCPMSQM